jgi:hypothetical protein
MADVGESNSLRWEAVDSFAADAGDLRVIQLSRKLEGIQGFFYACTILMIVWVLNLKRCDKFWK